MPYIPYGSFAQNRFIFISQYLGIESGNNSRRTKASCKAGSGMTTSHFTEEKKKFVLNDNKEIKHIIRPFSKIHQNIVLSVQNLGGGGICPPLPDASHGPAFRVSLSQVRMVECRCRNLSKISPVRRNSLINVYIYDFKTFGPVPLGLNSRSKM